MTVGSTLEATGVLVAARFGSADLVREPTVGSSAVVALTARCVSQPATYTTEAGVVGKSTLLSTPQGGSAKKKNRGGQHNTTH